MVGWYVAVNALLLCWVWFTSGFALRSALRVVCKFDCWLGLCCCGVGFVSVVVVVVVAGVCW